MLTLDDLKSLDEYQYPNVFKLRENENDFIDDLIDGSNYVNELIIIIAHIVIEKSLNKTEKAILTGHMAYLCKLYNSFLCLICKNQLEASMIISRILSEIAIRLKYLINNISSEIVQKYIKSSLAYDKKRYLEIKKKIQNNNSTNLGERMMRSIESRFLEEKYNIDDIHYQNDKFWCKNLEQLAQDMQLNTDYEFGYRTWSLAIHGSWDFMKTYNLTEDLDSGLYGPNISSSSARPQIIEAVNYLCLKAALEYLNLFSDNDVKIKLKNYLSSALNWLGEMSIAHEKFEENHPN